MDDKNLQLDRTVFFCDAVVAIAITLLAFNLKVGQVTGGHLTFNDILQQWKVFAAFLLSFFNIASFWKTHHSFFACIKKVDEKLLWCNILWLLFIIVLPFSTSLVSTHFFDTPAIFVYSLNILLIAVFQNNIWDYASMKPDFIKPGSIDKRTLYMTRLFCNLEMISALLAIALSFVSPGVAFLLLVTKVPTVLLARLYLMGRRKRVRGSLPNGDAGDGEVDRRRWKL